MSGLAARGPQPGFGLGLKSRWPTPSHRLGRIGNEFHSGKSVFSCSARCMPMRGPPPSLYLVMMLALSSGGCVSDIIAGDRVRGDGDAVTVQGTSALDAMALAVGHCYRSSKSAEYVGPAAGGRYRYRCV